MADWLKMSLSEMISRLLVVDPKDRLTVKDVLEHPWLSEAPLTVLQSPAVLLDKVC
jgi:serine/threonine protein kinase